MNFRLKVLLTLLSLGFAAVGARLVHLQLWRRADLAARADDQSNRWLREAPRRGPILDRNGDVLVESVRTASCFADPRRVQRAPSTARVLGGLLGMSPDDIARRIRRAPGAFVWIKRGLSLEEARDVQGAGLEGVGLKWEYRRRYPDGALAASLLGWVGEEGRGLSGLELAFDEVLTEPGSLRRAVRDGRGVPLAREADDRNDSPRPYLTLTLDRAIQFIAEKELEWGLARSRARSGLVLVQDCRDGEILAMAQRPALDPVKGPDSPRELEIHPAQWAYEPGSTFKVVTAAAALEERRVRPGDLFDCERGQWSLAGITINDHDPQGVLTFARSMEVSSNIGLAKVGLRVGKEQLYDYIRAFGFGSRTGSEIPGESAGLLKAPSEWSGTSLPVISFGQEVGVTPLQLVSAYSAVANGGWLREPRLFVEHRDATGRTRLWRRTPPVRRVISESTALTLRKILRGVVEKGTGGEAGLEGWSVAGKTGTAQKMDPATRRYSETQYVASFCGFVPSENPRLSILVVFDEPQGVSWGGTNAGPVFRNVAWRALTRMGVAPDLPPRVATGHRSGTRG
jgi:cell division protein FtsI (penicillin-binding protein 3)